VWRKLGIAVEGTGFHTDGFPIVATSERGLIDNNAAVNYHNVNVKLDYRAGPRANVFVRTGDFHENRANAKYSTTDGLRTEEGNDTTWRFLNGGVRLDLPGGNALQASVFSNFETFHSNFLAVPAATPARSVARATLNQTVPTRDAGGMAQWSRPFGRRNVVTAGTDWHWVRGESQEDGLDAVIGTQVILHRVSGGRQRSVGVFVQDVVAPTPKLTISFAARVDHFQNYSAHNLENTVSGGVLGAPTVNNNASLPGQTENVGTPRLGVMYHVTSRVNIWANANSGFRAPTLNELYRQFRKGTTNTLANYALVPERLVGSEGGVSVALTRDVTARATVFDNRVRHPVTNVTITTPITPATLPTATASCTPSANQICVQRQNVGRTEIAGFQTDVEWQVRSWRIAAAYVHEKATVKDNATNTALVGNLLPQVPRNRGSVRLAYVNPKVAVVSFEVQGAGAQFDDDLNTPSRLLPRYGTAGLTVARTIVRRCEAFFAVQNMFNKTYNVATLPTTIGSPRLVEGGLRVSWSGR
jgi:outer membrane receptor protein involved in Fe transport